MNSPQTTLKMADSNPKFITNIIICRNLQYIYLPKIVLNSKHYSVILEIEKHNVPY